VNGSNYKEDDQVGPWRITGTKSGLNLGTVQYGTVRYRTIPYGRTVSYGTVYLSNWQVLQTTSSSGTILHGKSVINSSDSHRQIGNREVSIKVFLGTIKILHTKEWKLYARTLFPPVWASATLSLTGPVDCVVACFALLRPFAKCRLILERHVSGG